MDDKIKDLAIVLLESVETTRLDARARLFLKWGHLVQTIHATVAIMELAPSSVSHYLHTGMLDPFKDITHQWSSVDSIVLKQVLRMHPWFQRLVKTQTAAYGINSNHINIISKLPSYTVMQNIVPRILDDGIVFNLVDPGSIFDMWHTWTNRTWEWLAVWHWGEDLLEDGYQRASAILPCIGSMTVLHPHGDILSNITKDTSSFLKHLTSMVSSSRRWCIVFRWLTCIH